MLIRFNVKNFLSFNETELGKSVEFSMIAGKISRKNHHIYEDEKIKLLKLATIYGANASGKSNLVKALNFIQTTIIKGTLNNCNDKYCKIKEENRILPSYFELEMKVGNKYYAYGFEAILNQNKYISEWLIELSPTGKEKLIFSRDIINGKIEFGKNIANKTNGLGLDKLKLYASDIKEDDKILFLTIMNQNKTKFYQEQKNTPAKAFSTVYDWVKYSLNINYPNQPISGYRYFLKTNDVKQISKIISSFSTGITNFHLLDIPQEKIVSSLPPFYRERLIKDVEDMMDPDNKKQKSISVRVPDNLFLIYVENDKLVFKTIQFEHENKNILFKLSEESDGTIRILDLIEILLAENDKTFIIDELDRCLHPSLTEHFIKCFLESSYKKNIQLIVTTHESRLLDFNLLRRDEIWFVEKNINGESQVYSLEEYNERFDKKIDKAYLEGRYGGIPIFTTLFPLTK